MVAILCAPWGSPVAKWDLVVELYYGGTWNEVPAYVRNPVTITRERPAGSEPTPFSATVTLQGIHNPKNPLSPLYGLAGQNTPIRFTLDADTRYYGEVASWEPDRSLDYDATTGKGDAWTVVTANGILRRLGQGADPLRSPMFRSMSGVAPGDYVPDAYWSMEDGSSATQFASGLTGGAPMLLSGSVSLADNDTMPGSEPLPTFEPGSSAVAQLSGLPSTGQWVIQVALNIPAEPAADKTYVSIDMAGGPVARYTIEIDTVFAPTALVSLVAYDSSGAVITDGGPLLDGVPWTEAEFFGHWFMYTIGQEQNGADTITWLGVTDAPEAGSVGLGMFTHAGASPGTPTRVRFIPDETMSAGHLAVFTDPAFNVFTDAYYNARAMEGWAGELAHERIERLCAEEGIPLTVQGTSPHAMGPQPRETLAALFAEIERTDDGLLYEPRASFELIYRCGQERLNRAVVLALDWATNDVAQPFRPALDDLGSRNDVTVMRRDGGSARAVLESGPLSVQEPPDGIGRYTTSIDVNTSTDDVLPHHAWWHLSKGTVDGIRYDRVTVDLDASTALVTGAAAVGIGDTITIDNLPADEHPGQVRLTVLGYTETIGSHRRLITFNCVPAAVYEVGVYATDPDGMVSRYDSRSSTLAAAVDADDTSWWVSTARLGARWVSGSSAPTFPFQITAGGLVYSVSAIGPSIFDSYTRSAASSWGSTSTGAQPWTVAGTASDYNVTGSEATMSLGSVGTARQATLAGLSLENVDHQISVKLAAGVFPSGANVVAQLTGRRNGAGTTFYLAQLLMQPGPTLAVRIQKTVSGVGTTTLATAPITRLSYGSNTYFTLRLAIIGSTVAAKAWMTSGAEPGYWDAVVTDTSITGPGAVSVLGILSAGNTNTLPVLMTFDNYQINNPPQFTTVRLGAGNDKSHGIGTQISDYRPARYALGEG